MKLLKIRFPNGYKMLKKDFEINFMTKTRISKESPNSDLMELEPGLHYPIETAFIGKNSSGKSTTLEAIYEVVTLIRTGRLSGDFDIPEGGFALETLFYASGCIYRYRATFVENMNPKAQFALIENEALERASSKAPHKKDLSNALFEPVKDFEPNLGSDTSSVASFAAGEGELTWGLGASSPNAISVFAKILPPSTMDALLHLFDDSIEYIRPLQKQEGDAFEFKRLGQDPRVVDRHFLDAHLSGGTLRGISLYGFAALVLSRGGELIVDEIETNFNKNLIGNLILMFNDPTINKRGGTLIYSTHYAELLDENDRCDNINVLHREGTEITIKNMCSDYRCRTDMVKSAMFDQNAFDNHLNYDRLLALIEELRNGVPMM